MTRRRTVLVVEDGTEYSDAFQRLLATDSVEVVRAGDRAEAARVLADRRVDALFLDVVFDRTETEHLAGHLDALVRRFGGDRQRAQRHLAENQGFYLFRELAPLLPAEAPIVIAYDFSEEPERLAALRASHGRLSGVADGTPISSVFDGLTSGGRPGALP
jgi:CheY-like chemotaxis protein